MPVSVKIGNDPMTITRSTTPPTTAVLNDQWIDTADLDKIYVCTTAYDSTLVERSLAHPGFGGSALTFRSVAPHGPSSLQIVAGGPTGTTGVSRSGTGTDGDPYRYILTVYDNQSSNDAIIAALGAMPTLTAEGASATNGTAVAMAQTDMVDNIKADKWTVRAIFARFVAVPPQMNVSDGDLPGYIPPAIRMVLPEATALRLAAMDGGGDLNRAALWQGRISAAMKRAKMSQQAVKTTKQSRRYF